MNALDPWSSEKIEEYDKIVRRFGLQSFNAELFPSPNRLMRRGLIFAGRDLQVISECIKEKKEYYALTGIMPSGDKLHFGSKMVVEQLKYFQEHGAKTFILIADLEAASTRGVSLEDAKRRAKEFHIPAYLALGLDPKKTTFYFQSENREVMRLGYEFAKHITLNEFRAIYGSADPGRIMAAVTQCGDMLFPQLEKTMPGIIPVGIDQDPHVRLCRDVESRMKSKYGFVPISSVYHKFMPSLDGSMKMSKSAPGSMIELPEDPVSACKKLKNALSGGRNTLEEHRRLGGIPEKDMVFELLRTHLIDDDKELARIHEAYSSGAMLTGELKALGCELMTVFMNDFTQKLEKARKQVDKLHWLS